MVVLPVEHLPDGQLYSVVPGIGGMVRPTQCLLQVIRRLIVELPPQGHQVVPFFKDFLIGGLEGIDLIFPFDLQPLISVHDLYCYTGNGASPDKGSLISKFVLYVANNFPGRIVQACGH